MKPIITIRSFLAEDRHIVGRLVVGAGISIQNGLYGAAERHWKNRSLHWDIDSDLRIQIIDNVRTTNDQ